MKTQAPVTSFTTFMLMLGVLGASTGCERLAAKIGGKRSPASSASVTAAPEAKDSSIAAGADAGPASLGSCVLDPPAGAVSPISSAASDLRLGASGKRALVSWVEPYGEASGRRIPGRIFDADTRSLSAERELDNEEMGDMIPSGVVPIEIGSSLAGIGCLNSAPSGTLYCWNFPSDEKAKRKTLFSLSFGNYGPQSPGIAVVNGDKEDDLAIFLPEGGDGDVAVFVPAVSSRRKTHSFRYSSRDQPAHADALVATRSQPGQATVVFRYQNGIRARHAGFDEKWRSKALTLSESGALVGAPVVAALGDDVVALFSSRAKAAAPWAITRAVLEGDRVTRTTLPTGTDQAQAPGIVADGRPGCALVSWVEGQGKATRTRLARSCDGQLDTVKAMTLSRPSIEGGRAYLAKSAEGVFVAWEEFPKAGAREVHVARVLCR